MWVCGPMDRIFSPIRSLILVTVFLILVPVIGVADIVWAQEEPKNMGPLSYLLLHFEKISTFRLASRPFSDATASGSSKRSEKRHKKVIEAVFKKN